MSDSQTVVNYQSVFEQCEQRGFDLTLEEVKGKPTFLMSHEDCLYSLYFTDLYQIQNFLSGADMVVDIYDNRKKAKEKEKK